MRPLFALLLLAGCSAESVHHQFNVEMDDGAVIPVQVRGNAASGRMVIFESGGPSGPGIAERAIDRVTFDPVVEERAAVVMYDRRGTGNALGDYSPDDLTVDRLIADLKTINRVLDDRYAPDSKVLVGHSFGTVSSIRAIADHGQQYDGWVAIAPAWSLQDFDLQIHFRRQFACRVAADQVASGDDARIWTRTLDWCDRHEGEVLTEDSDDLDPLWDALAEIEDRLEPWPAMDAGGVLGAALFSHYNLFDTQLRANRISEPIWASVEDMDAFTELEAIDLPTAIIAGEYDAGAVEQGLEAVDRMPNAELIEIEDAGHYPFEIAPKTIANAILDRFADQ